jgi:hypothetical protein
MSRITHSKSSFPIFGMASTQAPVFVFHINSDSRVTSDGSWYFPRGGMVECVVSVHGGQVSTMAMLLTCTTDEQVFAGPMPFSRSAIDASEWELSFPVKWADVKARPVLFVDRVLRFRLMTTFSFGGRPNLVESATWKQTDSSLRRDAMSPPPTTRLPPLDTRPPSLDTRPPSLDTRPPSLDTRPPPLDTRPPPLDTRPPPFDTRSIDAYLAPFDVASPRFGTLAPFGEDSWFGALPGTVGSSSFPFAGPLSPSGTQHSQLTAHPITPDRSWNVLGRTSNQHTPMAMSSRRFLTPVIDDHSKTADSVDQLQQFDMLEGLDAFDEIE